jgi:ubiquinone/menaquinone biosynthesis C-methylase UbiE
LIVTTPEGWHGWDAYAAFYDWENVRTFGRRDLAFWRRLAANRRPTLELGCGTGRVLVPIARAGTPVTGLDRSTDMLARAARRARRLPPRQRPSIVRGDIRAIPFRRESFGLVIAAYGLIQSVLNDSDLAAVLAEVARVLTPGGRVGLDLVPDLPDWKEYRRQLRCSGRMPAGGRLRLVETVRQDRKRGITTFDEEFIQRFGTSEKRRRFRLTFRTVAVPELVERLRRAGLETESLAGDYRGGPWTPSSDTWLVVAKKI